MAEPRTSMLNALPVLFLATAILVVSLVIGQIVLGRQAEASEISATAGSLPSAEDMPRMRVGITQTLEEVQLSADKFAEIKTDGGEVLAKIPAGDLVTIKPVDDGYRLILADQTLDTDGVVRVVPRRGGIVTVENFEHRPSWDLSLNDNRFRGVIEVARGSDGSTWVVNVLRVGPYVRGIAEAGGTDEAEFHKALAVAARTYAVYNMLHPTKHAGEPYILDATANDQVYLGYGFEFRAPYWAQAARDTSRQVLTYNGEVIVAPYFSQSDGRTRAWAEVWNGDYAWAQSVDDPCCEGLSLLGHGVGLSGRGARYFADQGWDDAKILEYYYQGVSLVTF